MGAPPTRTLRCTNDSGVTLSEGWGESCPCALALKPGRKLRMRRRPSRGGAKTRPGEIPRMRCPAGPGGDAEATAEEYQEDAADLKDTSKYKPHILLSQENTQIRDLQQENRELWISLEEHQDALELIMSKYRKQMLHLIMGRKDVDAEPVLKVHVAHSVEIESHVDRICEMGEVMRKAVQMDDDQFCKIQEKLAQLELENKELRELLSISKETIEVRREELPDIASQVTQ
ncbi:suppressor of IKBKE 1 isoform X1 [Lepidochelys kempii]|uniref:suppressor of IKBKE 1 isoform X1 n=1 Tax=Lepidochelys kempii TaxID=8472 RepID=UPI003C7056E9